MTCRYLQVLYSFLLPNPVHIYFLPPAAVSEDAIRLNETLRTPDKTLEKSLPELQSEAKRMVTELRSRNLHFQERIAQDELKWVERVFSLLVTISDSCNCHPFQPGVQAGSLQWRKTVWYFTCISVALAFLEMLTCVETSP